MWLLLIVAHVGGYNIPVTAIQDLYSKEDCQNILQVVKKQVNDSKMEYTCLYIKDTENE